MSHEQWEQNFGTATQARELSDVDVWRELTWSDIDEYEEEPQQAHFSTDTLVEEIYRRWGKDALERIATVITGGKFSPDDEIRWLNEEPASFMKIVTGETTPAQFFGERW